MTTEHQQSVWNHDLPPASDLTFTLATLQRIEQRRWRREVIHWLLQGVLVAVVSWLLWPWFSELLVAVLGEAMLELPVIGYGLVLSAIAVSFVWLVKQR